MHRLVLVPAALLILAPCHPMVLATPMDAAWIPEDASWTIHLDVDRLMQSKMVEAVAGPGVTIADLIEEEAQIDLDDLDEEFPSELVRSWVENGIELDRDLHAITAFGLGAEEEPEGVIIETSAAIDRIIADLEPFDGVDAVRGRDLSMVMIRPQDLDPECDPDEPPILLAIQPNGATGGSTILVGHDIEKIVANLERHETQRHGGPAWASPSPDAMIFVRADPAALDHGAHGIHGGPHSQLVEKAESIRMELGEDDRDFFIAMSLATSDPDDLQNMSLVANGLIGMGRLVLASEPDAAPLIAALDHLRITSDPAEGVIALDFRMPIEQAGALMRALDDDHDDAAEIIIEHHIDHGHDHDEDSEEQAL